MTYIPARNEYGVQTKRQSWDVAIKDVEGSVVFLQFDENVFRKHFVLPSKKPGQLATPQAQKIRTKAMNRFMAGVQGKSARDSLEFNPKQKSRSMLKSRYSDGVPKNSMIDLQLLGIDLVFTEMCTQLLARDKEEQWESDADFEMRIAFSKPCVVVSEITIDGTNVYSQKVPQNWVDIAGIKNGSTKPSYLLRHVR